MRAKGRAAARPAGPPPMMRTWAVRVGVVIVVWGVLVGEETLGCRQDSRREKIADGKDR